MIPSNIPKSTPTEQPKIVDNNMGDVIIWNPSIINVVVVALIKSPESAASRRVSIEQHHSQQRSLFRLEEYRNRPVVDVDVAMEPSSRPIAPIASGKMKAITPSFIWDPH
jgi:hypothetical protein